MSKRSKTTTSGKKSKNNSAGAGADLLRQMGIEMPNFDDGNFGMGGGDEDIDVDEDDLLSELELMDGSSGSSRSKKAKAPPKKPGAATQSFDAFQQDVHKLMKDIDAPINEDELSGDEDELLAELNELDGVDDEPPKEEVKTVVTKPAPHPTSSTNSIVSTLETRLTMYKQAVQTAKAKGEAPKARRYERQLNIIHDLLSNARAGKPVNQSDIPPELGNAGAAASQSEVVEQPAPAPPRPPSIQPQPISLPKNEPATISEPSVPKSNNTADEIARLSALAAQAVRQGDREAAKQYLIQKKTLENSVTATSTSSIPVSVPSQQTMPNTVPDEQTDEPPAIPLVAPVPRTIMEALEQRRNEFVKRQKEAASKGEGAKARRLDRVTKQYEEAMIATRKKQPFDYKELPDLPGFAPIPIEQGDAQPIPPPAPVQVRPSQPRPVAEPVAPPQQQPSAVPNTPSQIRPAAAAAVANPRNEQQIQLLRLRQKQFQDLALESKSKGEIQTAKEHYICSKQVEQMLKAAESGLPINMSQLPELPSNDFEVVRDDELTEQLAQSDRDTIFRRLQDDLLRQIQLCARNQQIYAQMAGETNSKIAKDFKHLEQRCVNELERVKQANLNGFNVPTFHYEKRQMNIIQVNNDLADNDCEVSVLRGINLHVPAGYTSAALQTYVIIEYPFPLDAVQTGRTRLVTGSTNAEYDVHPHKFQLKRTDRNVQRSLARKELKLTIYYKAGFLRSDKQLGVAHVKLAPLLKTSMIHESVDVHENDSRKKAEGKLEVKIRIKEPVGPEKSSELISQVWLVIDRFDNTLSNSRTSAQASISTAPLISALSHLIPSTEALGLLAFNLVGPNLPHDANPLTNSSQSGTDSQRNSQQSTVPQSIQVLKFEAETLDEQIERLEDVLSPDQIERLRAKHKELEEQKNRIVQNLREGGKQAMQEHIQNLEQLLERYKREEEDYRQRNDTKKADLVLNKKNLVAKEIETFMEPLDAPESTSF